MKSVAVFLAILLILYPTYYSLKNFRNNLGMYIGLLTLFTFPIIISGYFNVWPEKALFLILTTLGYFAVFAIYWFVEKRHMKALAVEHEFKLKVQEHYDNIQEEYGNLNELTKRPLNEEEKAYLNKQLKLNYWLGGIVIFLEIGGMVWIYLYGGDTTFIYILLGLLALTIIAVLLGSYQGRGYLKHDTMYTLKAVVLNKEFIDRSKTDDYYLILGDKEDEDSYKVIVTKQMYNKVNYGDIVQVKNFVDFFALGPIFETKVIGSINQSLSEQDDV